MITAAGIHSVQLEELGLLKVSGSQCVEFLQGQLSCDVREITPTQSRLGVHCNVKGRVLAAFRLFYIAPHYYLLLPKSMVSFLLKDLNKYALFYKVTLQDASQSFYKIGLVSLTLEEDLVPYIPAFKLEKDAVYTDQTTTLLVIPGSLPRAILLGQVPAMLANIARQPKPFLYWETIDVESGIVTLTPKIRALFTPHHLNYHKQGGINFTKGCYTGQEIIARMHYLGKSTQKLYQLAFNSTTPFLPGTDIVDKAGKTQGTLVMTVPPLEAVEQSTYQALAVIRNTAILEALYLGEIPLKLVTSGVDSPI